MYPKDFHFSGFREESQFASRNNERRVPDLGRSGLGIRLCYNLRSVERTKDQTELPWSIRQTAVYHEFDMKTGRAVWIIVKGNKLIRNRMREASASPAFSPKSSCSDRFSASLAPHLLLCDWSGENWRWYINDLEDQLQGLTRSVLATRVDHQLGPVTSPITSPVFPRSPLSRSSTFPVLSRAATDQFRSISRAATSKFSFGGRSDSFQTKSSSRAPTLVYDSQVGGPVGDTCAGYVQGASADSFDSSQSNEKLASYSHPKVKPHIWATKSWWKSRNRPSTIREDVELNTTDVPPNDRSLSSVPPSNYIQKQNEGAQEGHSFSDLQKIEFIAEKAEETLLVLKSNSGVLGELKEHYIYAANHPEFSGELKAECQADLARFERCVSGVEKDLRMLQARTETLLSLLANRKSLVRLSQNMSRHWASH